MYYSFLYKIEISSEDQTCQAIFKRGAILAETYFDVGLLLYDVQGVLLVIPESHPFC